MIGLSVRPGRDRLIQPRNDFVAPERLFNEVQQQAGARVSARTLSQLESSCAPTVNFFTTNWNGDVRWEKCRFSIDMAELGCLSPTIASNAKGFVPHSGGVILQLFYDLIYGALSILFHARTCFRARAV